MKSKTKKNTVYDKIKEKIMYCQLMPGEFVSEKQLIEEMNASRTPVREALKVLSGEGLVTIIPKKGIQIAPFPIRKIKEIYELRRILEPLAIKKSMGYFKKSDIDYLKELNKSLYNSYKDNDLNKALLEGMRIHLYIAQISGNETLYHLLKSLREESYRGSVYYLTQYFRRCENKLKENKQIDLWHVHSDFIQALEEEDEEKAIKYVLDDLEAVTNLLLQI